MGPTDDTDQGGAPPTLPPSEARVTVGGRYLLTGKLGAGAFGEVWRATDRRSGGEVAVKLVDAPTGGTRDRVAREIGALRLVEHAGVVPLLDHGQEGGRAWMVMPVVEGRPFPGEARGWDAIRGPTLRLLDALRAVHARGLVHRDLKPANVLVRADGTVAVLDFGLARGRPLGATITATGAVLGTPRYLAPEQVTSARVDARADLYAVGVMLYQALAGAPPFAERGEWPRWLPRRTTHDAPSLALAAPGVPAAVVAAVDRLLARDPDRRPRSAGEALAELAAGEHPIHLPLLGRDAVLADVLARLEAGRAVTVTGPRGVGVTRFLAEVEARLAATGRSVHRLPPGHHALESLAALVGPLPDQDAPAVAEARLRARLGAGEVLILDRGDPVDHRSLAVVERARGGGAVLRGAALRGEEGVGGAGGALGREATGGGEGRAGPGGAAPDRVVLPALGVGDLRALFAGPDRVLHLPEDAARALVPRTDGLPARIVGELHAWLEAGWARREGERFALGRMAVEQLALDASAPPTLGGAAPDLPEPLDRLLAWIGVAPGVRPAELAAATGLPGWEVDDELDELGALGLVERREDGGVRARAAAAAGLRWNEEEQAEVERALADAMPPGRDGRLELLLRLGDGAGAAADALERATRADVRVARAMAELRACLPLVRTAEARGSDPGRAATTVAMPSPTEEAAPVAESPPVASPERALVEAIARLALSDGGAEALRSARTDAERAGLRDLAALLEAATCGATGDVPRAGALAEALPAFADPEIDAARRMLPIRALARHDPAAAERAVRSLPGDEGPFATRRRAWLAQVRYSQGRYEEAAALHLEAARGDPRPEGQIRAFVNAGGALLDALRIEDAIVVLGTARGLAVELRLPTYEAYAEAWLRAGEYRAGRAPTVDLGLLDALVAATSGVALGVAEVTEAAVAWRSGDERLASGLARRAARTLDALGNGPGALLARALAARTDPDADPAPIVASALACPKPRLAAQALALVWPRLDNDPPRAARARVIEAQATIAPDRREHRLEVLSIAECSRAVNGGTGVGK